MLLRLVCRSLILACLPLAISAAAVRAVDEKADKAAEATDADFPFQGEYSGNIDTPEGSKQIGVQLIALGEGKFRGVGYIGGLPGDGWDGSPPHEADGELKDGVVKIHNDVYDSVIDGKTLVLTTVGNLKLGELNKVARQSPTLGAKAPEGAVVLFDGSSTDGWEKGRLAPDSLLMQGTTSKGKFQNCTLHIEFRLPYMPKARGQGRANSGCYLQGRYEVQVLDSFGLKGLQNECGGIYSIKAPDENMCFPPLAWQTYDIDFTPAEYADGKKVKDGTMTVRHNGVVVHKDVKLTHATTAAPVKEGPEPGPIYLQDHGSPVRYRNIWLVEKK